MPIVIILKILTIVGLIATLSLLVVGTVGLFKISSLSSRNNQLMRWRVIMQAVTLLFFAGLLVVSKH